MIEIYFDGSCLVNPHGKMGYGYHVNLNGTEIECGFDGSPAKKGNSNNVAEYRGLIMALERCASLSNEKITVYGDSKMVINQMSGVYKIGVGYYTSSAQKCYALMRHLTERLGNKFSFKWIPRDQNARADELSNMWYNETQ